MQIPFTNTSNNIAQTDENSSDGSLNTLPNEDNDLLEDENSYQNLPPSASVGASTWWNDHFESRIEIILTEPNIKTRSYEPVDIYFQFLNNTCQINSTRIIQYSGVTQTEIPSQTWNATMWQNATGDSEFIQSCTVTYSVSINKNTQGKYYLYYSSLPTQSNIQSYYTQTKMTATYQSGRATVDTNKLAVQFAEGVGIDSFKFTADGIGGTNYHTSSSMSPLGIFLSGGASTTYTPDTNGFFHDWLIAGSFRPFTTDWANYSTVTTGRMHVDPTKYYTLNSYTTPELPAIPDATNVKQWTEYHIGTATTYVDFNPKFSPNEYAISYALCYVYIPQNEPTLYMKVGSDDGVRVIVDRNKAAPSYYNHVLRGAAQDQDVKTIALTEGWHSFMIMVEEMTGGWGFYFRLSRSSSGYTAIPGMLISFIPQCAIETIVLKQSGPIFSQWDIQWQNSMNMMTWDTLTFYQQYDMYKLSRTFWSANNVNEANGNDWTILNTNYETTTTTGMDDWVVDGISFSITTNNLNANNYAFAYDSGGNNFWTAQGVFLTGFSKGYEPMTLTDINITGVNNGGQPQIIPGYQTDWNNIGPHPVYSSSAAYNITVNMWEMAKKSIGIGGTIGTELNGLYNTLKTPLTKAVGSVEELFFNLYVQLYDTDDIGAEGVNVLLYNVSTDWNTIYWSQGIKGNVSSNSSGGIAFTGLKGGTYKAIIAFKAFNNPFINLTTRNVNLTKTDLLTIYNLNLTTITLSLSKRGEPTPIIGANVSLWWNNTGQPSGAYIGYKTSDSSGTVKFYYLNSSMAVGNFTIMVELYDQYKDINDTVEAIDDIDKMINFTAASAVSKVISVNLEDYSTKLTPDTTSVYQYWDKNITFSVVYSWLLYNGVHQLIDQDVISGATVTYEISQVGVGVVSTGTFKQGSAGRYTTTVNTSDAAVGLVVDSPFLINIEAERSGFSPSSVSVFILVSKIPTTILTSVEEIETNWNENISLDVYFGDTLNSLPLSGAVVEYEVRQTSEVQGIMQPNGTSGWYTVELNTTQFLYAGLYTLKFTAQKANYFPQPIEVELIINKIRTLLNGKIFVPLSLSVNVTTEYLFQFEYTDDIGAGIEEAAVARYEWSGDQIGEQGEGLLNESGNGVYVLDFNTEKLNLGEYSIVVSIGQTNYIERTSVIALSIVEKPIELRMGGDVKDLIVEKPQGEAITIEFTLIDPVASAQAGVEVPLTGANVVITYESKSYVMEEVAAGVYRYIIDTSAYTNLASATTFRATITITKANYTITPVEITISITPPEFVIGGVHIPRIFIYIIIIVGALAIATYAMATYIKYARIPAVIKRVMETRKVLLKNGSITDAKVLRSPAEIYNDENAEGMKLLGLEMKKTKTGSDDKNLAPGDSAHGGN